MLADRVVATVASAVEELGLRDDGGAVGASVRALTREPLSLYAHHAVWPSPFTAGGLPVELSLKLCGGGVSALRCVADVTDYRRGDAANASRYRDAALLVGRTAGMTMAQVDTLCHLHLDGAPLGRHAGAMHGLGYAGDGWSRGSVYFRTGWLDRKEMARRLPHVARALDHAARHYGSPTRGAVEVMGYDLLPGTEPRWKAYCWIPPTLGDHPDLAPARALLDAIGISSAPRALMLQVHAHGQRLFLLRPLWGHGRVATQRLRRALTVACGIDLAPFRAFARVAAAHGLKLDVALVAVGAEHGSPSATLYTWPSATSGSRRLRRPATAVARGTAFLLGARVDGGWSDGFVTAFVASMLLTAAPSRTRRALAATCERLTAAFGCDGWRRSAQGAADLETSALALSVLARGRRPLPAGACDALLRLYAQPPASAATTALVLIALLESASSPVAPMLQALFALVASQRADGGWPTPHGRGAAMTLWQVAHALRAYEGSAAAHSVVGAPSRSAAVAALRRAAGRSRSLPATVGELAAWIGARVTLVGDAGDPVVGRAVAALAAQQRPDGRWPGRGSDGDLIATAAAVGALQCARVAAMRAR
jgi:hypothetical protein